jgi:hypothetical protein
MAQTAQFPDTVRSFLDAPSPQGILIQGGRASGPDLGLPRFIVLGFIDVSLTLQMSINFGLQFGHQHGQFRIRREALLAEGPQNDGQGLGGIRMTSLGGRGCGPGAGGAGLG